MIQTKNFTIMCINEDGDASANASNTAGMGNVTAAQPSTNPGCTIGSDYSSGGGRDGSGDVGFPLNAPYRKTPGGSKNKKGKHNKFSKLFQIKQNWTQGQDKKSSKVMDWDTFNINKVTHL